MKLTFGVTFLPTPEEASERLNSTSDKRKI